MPPHVEEISTADCLRDESTAVAAAWRISPSQVRNYVVSGDNELRRLGAHKDGLLPPK